MQRVRQLGTIVLGLAVTLVASAGAIANRTPLTAPAPTRPNVPLLEGATEQFRFITPAGFIDDAVVADDTRAAYVVSDAADKAELHVVTLATKADQVVNISTVTTQSTSLAFIGKRVLVIGKSGEGHVAALVDLDPKAKKPIVYKTAVAGDITLITRDGKPRLALHRVKTGAAHPIKHEVEILAVETGARVGAVRAFEIDESNKNEKSNFKVNDWQDGFSRAHGVKSGEYDPKENQRAPDFEITFDVPTGKFIEKKKIEDLFEQRRRFQAYAETPGRSSFVRFSWDNTGLHLWHQQKLTPLALDQPLVNYDTKTLQSVVTKDGTGWIALKIDPVNAPAVARKKADPEYLDIFVAAPGATTATRKARILSTNARLVFGNVTPTQFWLLEKNKGFSRGGKALTFYSLP